MRGTEVVKRKLVAVMRSPRAGVWSPLLTADSIKGIPVASKDEAAKAALIKELQNIDRELNRLWRRYIKAADILEKLSVGAVLME